MTSINPDLSKLLEQLDHLDLDFIIQTDAKKPTEFWVYLDFSEAIVLDKNDPALYLDIISKKLGPPLCNQRLPFSGMVGFFSYEFLCKNIGFTPKADIDIDFPYGFWARPKTVIHFSNQLFSIYSTDSERKDFYSDLIAADSINEQPDESHYTDWRCNLSYPEYEKIFNNVKEEILDGNTYQIKISQRYESAHSHKTGKLFAELVSKNPAPESFALKYQSFSMVSSSPELVILYNAKEQKITTRPIGGTLDRKKTRCFSQKEIETSFYANPKEVHEHNMLIDLERNDLSRVCKSGTVKIDHYREIETYAHVHHLVSTISGEVKENTDLQTLLAAILPGGTVTGCPKYRTLELIDHYEPCFRGPYTGSFGTLADDGSIRLNLIIRTLISSKEKSYVQAGGGIVVDSTPEYEYNENKIKAQALLELFS